MFSNKNRIRIEYAPLNVAVSVVCDTPNSPTAQVCDVRANEYEPDRSLTPTVLMPRVSADAADGSWTDKNANALLAQMKWTVNGEDIATLPDWQGLYDIAEDADNRGAITIKRNLNPEESAALVFSAVLVDSRTNTNYPVSSDPVVLSSSAVSRDEYSVALGDSQIIRYDVFKDRLALYDYKVAHAALAPSAEARAAAMDINSYLRRIPVSVFCGEKLITEGFTLLFSRVNADLSLTELSAQDDEVEAMDNSGITLDLRLVRKADYLVKVMVDAECVAQIQFSINRIYRNFTVRPSNGTSIAMSDTIRFDEAMVDCAGSRVECAESMLRLRWMTDSAALKGKAHNEGARTAFSLVSTGIGMSEDDGWLDVYVEAEHKPPYSVATDTAGNVFSDSAGNVYIFN